ncbi:MAG TPA: hypothetical protein VD790_10260 [Thermoleophilaceae bacterium]|nr:hypothetical protein [Thermoleophilaceae bacterium]
MVAHEQDLAYEDVLAYLSDRDGDPVAVTSYPTFHLPPAGEFGRAAPTLLGLTMNTNLDKIEPVSQAESERWLDGRAGARIPFHDDEGHRSGDLVLTREWFTGAVLEDAAAVLRIVVFANTAAEPFYPPVGQERESGGDVPAYDAVGWGFALDFGGPPVAGRWARGES